MRRAPHLLLPIALLAPLAAAAPNPAIAAPETPVALGETASAPARLAAPAPVPFVVPPPAGTLELAAGESSKRVEDKVARGKPTAWRFVAPAKAMISIGISSPKGDVRLSVYDVGTKTMLGGTEPKDGAIRVTAEYPEATELLLVAHTASDETPFRFEVTLGAGSL